MPPIRGQNVDGNGMNFMEVVFENMRDLGEPDVEIIRVNRILEENYFDTAESFATTTPDIWDALCLPRNVMEAVMREITMDNRGVDKALDDWQSQEATSSVQPMMTTEEWERRRQEAARRGEEKRTVQLGEQAVSAGDGRGFDPGSAEKRIDSVEVVPYALKRLGDSHVSWVAVLQEAVQRLTNKNTAPGVGLFDWEYETRSAGVGGEKLEYRATVSFRVDIPEANGGVGYSNLLMKFIGCWHPTRKVSQREAARNAIETLKLNVDDLIARHGGDPNANILQSVHIRLQRYFGQRLHRAGATVMEWKHICSKIEEESPNGSAVKTEEFNSEGLGTAGVRPEDEIGLWQSTVTVPQLQKEFTSDWKNCKKDSQNDACFKLAAFLDSIGVPQANENPVRRKSSESGRKKGSSRFTGGPYDREGAKNRRFSGGNFERIPMNYFDGVQYVPTRVMNTYPGADERMGRYMMRPAEYNYAPSGGMRLEAPRPPPPASWQEGEISAGYGYQPAYQPTQTSRYVIGAGRQDPYEIQNQPSGYTPHSFAGHQFQGSYPSRPYY